MSLAERFSGLGKPKPAFPPKKAQKGKDGSLAAYIRTYGEKDGRTVFEAAQIKAKKRGKR